jgi:4-diphosphocytidyl-2-C-methyl-D-erythritol kinase
VPRAVTLSANAKLNLGLFIKGRRADGYHELETVFYPIPLADELTLMETTGSHPTLVVLGINLPGNPDQNLCIRVWHAIGTIVPKLPPVHIQLVKHIPAGAGLGGGSSDAAHTLTGLNALFELGLTNTQLHQLAVQLGADVPFFLENKPMLATGIGEVLEPINIDLSGYRLEWILPAIHSETALAYKGLDLTQCDPARSLRTHISQPISAWHNGVSNDFEAGVFARYAELAEIKQSLYDRGAVYASMSGSGSALYGIFPA